MLVLGLLLALVLGAARPAQGPEGTAILRGRVVDADTGKPLAGLALQLYPQPRGPRTVGIDAQPPVRSAITAADGGFTVERLVASEYSVSARTPSDYLDISTHVIVGDGARVDVLIRATRGANIATFDGAAPHGRVSLYLTPADADGLADDNNGVFGAIAPDGTFALNGVPPGHFVMRVMSSDHDTWKLASATLAQADIADTPLTVAHDDIDGLHVVLTTSRTVLRGIATRADGAPANGVSVVAFSIDDALRAVRNSRRVAIAETTIAGEYEIGGLPGGTYGLAIADDVDREVSRDPSFAKKLVPLVTVTLAPGESRTQNISVR